MLLKSVMCDCDLACIPEMNLMALDVFFLGSDLDTLSPGLVPASFPHSAPATDISNRASAPADPGVVDDSEGDFALNLDPTLPGLYDCLFRGSDC